MIKKKKRIGDNDIIRRRQQSYHCYQSAGRGKDALNLHHSTLDYAVWADIVAVVLHATDDAVAMSSSPDSVE